MGRLAREHADLNFARWECGWPPLPDPPEVIAERAREAEHLRRWDEEREAERVRRLVASTCEICDADPALSPGEPVATAGGNIVMCKVCRGDIRGAA